MKRLTNREMSTLLNGICPYFTMFPLDFPYRILARHAGPSQTVLDPFCGRGTTNFAARLLGLYSVGIDASPVAAAVAAAKLVSPTVEEILAEAKAILQRPPAAHVPAGEFWELAYHANVLQAIARFREAFLEDCTTPARIALRAILMGALHGPKRKTLPSYLSNQSPRTYAPKPRYAVRYWRSRNLLPDNVDVLGVIERRVRRYYGSAAPNPGGIVRWADSRRREAFELSQAHDALAFRPSADGDAAARGAAPNRPRSFNWIITSPPYYGMTTYIPDQWLRHWFVGGPDEVEYSVAGQLAHSSPDEFAADLQRVWRNVHAVAADDARLVVRFGGVSQRKADPRAVLEASLAGSGWRIVDIRPAGTAKNGYRQADGFLKQPSTPVEEFDVWARPD